MSRICERCSKQASANLWNPIAYCDAVEYDEDYDGYLCGTCSNDFSASMDDYEDHKRDRLAREQEY
jgi:hypothetical protein